MLRFFSKALSEGFDKDARQFTRTLVKELNECPVHWKDVAEPSTPYRTVTPTGKEVFLKVGDFPEEPLYTVAVKDSKGGLVDIASLDDMPENWHLPPSSPLKP